MRNATRVPALSALGLILALAWAGQVNAASHQWRFNELFTNSDGTIQFIEMKECCGFSAEHEISGKWILVVGADNQYTFRSNLTGDTANRHLLLATQGFADILGAPTPDFIIPDNFIPTDGDSLEYWMYSNATIEYPQLPTDGITSLNVGGTTGQNSPTNYAGESGSIDVTPVLPSTWGRMKAFYW